VGHNVIVGWSPVAVDGGAADHRAVIMKRIALKIEDGRVPCGRALDEAGRSVEFSGWVGLAAAIDRVRGVSPVTHATIRGGLLGADVVDEDPAG
jgi:hypothetical protein